MSSKTDDIMLAIGRLQGAVEEGFKNTDANFTRVNGRLGKHDQSIDSLQSWQDIATGRFAIIGTIATFAAGIVGAFINRKFF